MATERLALAARRLWVAGHTGMVGSALVRRLSREDCELVTVDHAALDLTRQADVETGVWLRVFEALAKRAPDSLHLIDSSIVRAHQHAAGGKKVARITPSVVLVAD